MEGGHSFVTGNAHGRTVAPFSLKRRDAARLHPVWFGDQRAAWKAWSLLHPQVLSSANLKSGFLEQQAARATLRSVRVLLSLHVHCPSTGRKPAPVLARSTTHYRLAFVRGSFTIRRQVAWFGLQGQRVMLSQWALEPASTSTEKSIRPVCRSSDRIALCGKKECSRFVVMAPRGTGSAILLRRMGGTAPSWHDSALCVPARTPTGPGHWTRARLVLRISSEHIVVLHRKAN